jgi:hypothetical protein
MGPQMTSQYGTYALRAGLARLYARMCIHTPMRVILFAFSQQQWFHERASILRYTYIACLVLIFMQFVMTSFHITACVSLKATRLYSGQACMLWIC